MAPAKNVPATGAALRGHIVKAGLVEGCEDKEQAELANPEGGGAQGALQCLDRHSQAPRHPLPQRGNCHQTGSGDPDNFLC